MKPDPSSPLRWPLLLALLSIAVLLAGSWLTRGFLTSDSLLAFELAAPEQAAYEWPIRQDAPFKYRLLFPTVVEGTWQLLRSGPTDNATFLLVYRAWSIVFYCAAVLSLYALLRVTGFGRDAAGAGGILMLLLPAMALAFTYPVHTHEDTLAYALLNLGLIAMIRERYLLFCCTVLVGVTCRETLLVLPAVFLLDHRASWVRRLLPAALGGALFLAIRWSLGTESYNVLRNGLWDNLGRAANSAAFLFLSFGCFWLLAIAAWWRGASLPQNPGRALMFRGAPLAALLIVGTTVLVGRIEEIRLLHLLAPWVIVLSLDAMQSGPPTIAQYLRSAQCRRWLAGAGVALAAALFAVYAWKPHLAGLLPTHWWLALLLMLLATGALLPQVWRLLHRAARAELANSFNRPAAR